jgi:hypothetical protein
MEPLRRLSSLNEHRFLLREVFQTARERVLIVSPFVSKSALQADGIPARVQLATRRGVAVMVYVDNDLNRVEGSLKRSANDGIAELIRSGATVIVLDGIHNKTLIRDNDLITEGSFNWLSAVRTAGGTHQREERTLVVEGAEARQMIEDEIKGLTSKRGGIARIKSTIPESTPAPSAPVPASIRKPTAPAVFDPAAAQPSRLVKFFGYFFMWVFALILVAGLFGAEGIALVILGAVIIVPIVLLRSLNAKPFPKYTRVFTDEELGISDAPKKKEEWGGNYSLTGPDYNSQDLFNPTQWTWKD